MPSNDNFTTPTKRPSKLTRPDLAGTRMPDDAAAHLARLTAPQPTPEATPRPAQPKPPVVEQGGEGVVGVDVGAMANAMIYGGRRDPTVNLNLRVPKSVKDRFYRRVKAEQAFLDAELTFSSAAAEAFVMWLDAREKQERRKAA